MEGAFSVQELTDKVGRDAFWLLREMQDATGKSLRFNDNYIDSRSYAMFVTWYNKTYGEVIEPPKKTPKRAYSTTHRIEIAFKSKYKCNACDILLPPTFEVDHIVELRNGGKDEFSNLQALCNNCHAAKTRANTLKLNTLFQKEFTERAEAMEKNAFEKFKRRESKYFSSNDSR